MISSKTATGNRNFRMGYDANFNFCMGDFGGAVSNNPWGSTDFTINWNTRNIGIGIANQSKKLYVNGSTYLNGNTTINGNLGIGTTPFSDNTRLTIRGSSFGYSQPLVRIEQTAGWDGNYCLQTVLYTKHQRNQEYRMALLEFLINLNLISFYIFFSFLVLLVVVGNHF